MKIFRWLAGASVAAVCALLACSSSTTQVIVTGTDASTDAASGDSGALDSGATDAGDGDAAGNPAKLAFQSATGTVTITSDGGAAVPTTGASLSAGVTTLTDPGDGPAGYAFLDFTTRAMTCDDLPVSNHAFKSTTDLSLYVVQFPLLASADPSLGLQTYTIGGSQTLLVGGALATTDDACGQASTTNVTSGSVTFTSQTASELRGSFALTLADGSHVDGDFDFTPSCASSPPEPDLRTTVDAGTPACE